MFISRSEDTKALEPFGSPAHLPFTWSLLGCLQRLHNASRLVDQFYADSLDPKIPMDFKRHHYLEEGSAADNLGSDRH